jgi:two-component system NtrC family sensor kinase
MALNFSEPCFSFTGTGFFVARPRRSLTDFAHNGSTGSLRRLAMENSDSILTFYRTFRDISKSVHSSTNVEEVLHLAVRKTTEALNARGSILRILNLKTGELELNAAYGLSDRYLSKGHVFSTKVIQEFCEENRAILIKDLETDPRVQYPKEAKEEGIKMMVDLPLFMGQNVVGILRIFFDEKREFSEQEMDFAVAIAEQCALAIDKARLIEKQQLQYDNLAIQTDKLSSLGRMAAGIAHEINNPLAGILLYSSNLVKKVPETGPLKKGLEVIIHETIRCRGIIQDLLEFSRKREPVKALADLNGVINKALNILVNEFRLNRVSVEKRLSDNLPNVLIDVNQIEQVFINFFMNAIEAIQGQGQVSVRSYKDEENQGVVVAIEDSGMGIPQEHLKRIFEPFFSTKPKGTGLGLAVNYGLIQKHGGQIRVSSQPGHGTTMTIRLPYDQAAA